MRSLRTLLTGAGALGVAGVIAAVGSGAIFVTGADHLDSPLVKTDHRVDITDIYAWRTGASWTTLALDVNPLTTPADTRGAAFRPNAIYEFKIDTNGDAQADIAYRIRFSAAHWANGAVEQQYTIKRATGAAARRTEWTGATIAEGRTTRDHASPVITAVRGGGKAFAGPRDDPFFFDLIGFKHLKSRILAGRLDLGHPGDTANCALADSNSKARLLSCFTGHDTFAGTNVSAIVLTLPNAMLGGTGHTVGIWATTAVHSSAGWQRIDRMGRPAINTVFNITDAQKDTANQINPTGDRAFMKARTVAVLEAFAAVVKHAGATPYTAGQINGLANVLLPDTLTIQLGNSAGFLNGRKPADDVINAEFALVTNGALTSDGVNHNDRSFLSTFPYLAAPH